MSGISEFKVILVGEVSVGKTSLILRFTDKKFYEAKPTINVDIKTVYLDVNGKECLMHILDTGGQETFYSLGTSFFRGADGVIFVYDETRPDTFEKIISNWVECIENKCRPQVVKILAGNKTDSKEGKRVLSSRVKRFAEEKNLEVIKTSAKNDSNVKEVFLRLIELIALSKGIVQGGTAPMVRVLESPDNLLKAIDESKESYKKERRLRFVQQHSQHLKGIRLCTPHEIDNPQKPVNEPEGWRCCTLL